ncbi:hypothetical protein [Halovulum sp. GXIMD14793]
MQAAPDEASAFFAMVKIADTTFYVQEKEDGLGAMTASLYIYVPDTDAA